MIFTKEGKTKQFLLLGNPDQFYSSEHLNLEQGKSYFINTNVLIMSCKFNTNKNKWIPIDEAKVQKIDIINNDKRLKIVEQEIIENDIEQNDDE